MTWVKNVAIAFDQFLAVLLCIGNPGETISGRAGIARREGKLWGCVLCRFLDAIERNHCELSIAGDLARAGKVKADE